MKVLGPSSAKLYWSSKTGWCGATIPPPSDPLAALPGPGTSQTSSSRPEKHTSAPGAECGAPLKTNLPNLRRYDYTVTKISLRTTPFFSCLNSKHF